LPQSAAFDPDGHVWEKKRGAQNTLPLP